MHTKFILKDEISFHVVHVYRGMESFSSCLKFHPTRSQRKRKYALAKDFTQKFLDL